MEFERYQGLAMRTSTEGHDRVKNGCLGLIGESGEIVDAVKKWLFQSGENPPMPTDKLIDECGDVLWYCAELATGLEESLYSLYERFQADFWQDMHPMNEGASLDQLAVRLAMTAQQPYIDLYDGSPVAGINLEWAEARAMAHMVGVMVTVRDLLEIHCGSTMDEAMARNIEKLIRRYPDGFDPQRSLYRNADAE